MTPLVICRCALGQDTEPEVDRSHAKANTFHCCCLHSFSFFTFFFTVNKHKPWIETSYHGVITENMDTVLLDPPLVALDKDAPVPFAGRNVKCTYTQNTSPIHDSIGYTHTLYKYNTSTLCSVHTYDTFSSAVCSHL